MTDPRLSTALANLEHGGWSLTINGFAKHALKIKHDLSDREYRELREMMHATGLPHRRVKFGDGMIDCWDYQK